MSENQPPQNPNDSLNPTKEPFPTHEKIKVIKGITVFKNKKWWEAVLIVETNFGGTARRKVTWYRWNWGTVTPRDGSKPYQKWIRKEHKNINFKQSWDEAKKLIDTYVTELGS